MQDQRADQRQIARLNVLHSDAFNAILKIGHKKIPAHVNDFHSHGMSLLIDPKFLFDLRENLPTIELELLYGKKKISHFEDPVILSISDEGRIRLRLTTPKVEKYTRDTKRIDVKGRFNPVAMIEDPLKMGEVLHFDIINLSADGMLLRTSLANKHLVPGSILHDLQVILPGLQVIKTNVQLRRFQILNGFLNVGTAFVNPSPTALEALAQFALFGMTLDAPDTIQILADLKAAKFDLKKIGGGVRLSLASTPEEYGAALRVRHEAYKAVAKVGADSTPSDMADEYDAFSLILIVQFRNHVIGTARLVEIRQEGQKFPFESHFKFEDVIEEGNRGGLYEISRLAILPQFQGTDLLVRMFQELSKISLVKGKYAVCLATKATRKNYIRLGWRQISPEIAHPVLTGETLAMFRVDADQFLTGKRMSGIAWFKIAKVVTDHLAKFEIMKTRSFNPRMVILKNIETMILSRRKNIKKIKKA